MRWEIDVYSNTKMRFVGGLHNGYVTGDVNKGNRGIHALMLNFGRGKPVPNEQCRSKLNQLGDLRYFVYMTIILSLTT